MYTLAVKRELIAQHFLVGGDWGPENELHSHHYQIEVQLQGKKLDRHGYLVDIVEVEARLEELVNYYRDKTLNILPEFEGLNPSIEHFARLFCRQLRQQLQAPNLSALQVRIWENEIAWTAYREEVLMRLGLVIYGNLEMVTGGFLYDKLVVEYLQRQGDEVEIIGLPWHPYALSLGHNFWPEAKRRLTGRHFDAVIQDELVHPSLVWLNQRLKPQLDYPLISLVHLLRSTEERPAWQNRFYRWVEQRYVRSADGFIFISRHTRQVVELWQVRGNPLPLLIRRETVWAA